METAKPFPLALRELLIENDYVTRTGKPNWAAFASELEGFHYETLRQAATGRRRASPHLIEECARALRVKPERFLEYRIYLAQREFEPAAVGHERVLENLARWERLRADRWSSSVERGDGAALGWSPETPVGAEHLVRGWSRRRRCRRLLLGWHGGKRRPYFVAEFWGICPGCGEHMGACVVRVPSSSTLAVANEASESAIRVGSVRRLGSVWRGSRSRVVDTRDNSPCLGRGTHCLRDWVITCGFGLRFRVRIRSNPPPDSGTHHAARLRGGARTSRRARTSCFPRSRGRTRRLPHRHRRSPTAVAVFARLRARCQPSVTRAASRTSSRSRRGTSQA
jgi:hypothetical protein